MHCAARKPEVPRREGTRRGAGAPGRGRGSISKRGAPSGRWPTRHGRGALPIIGGARRSWPKDREGLPATRQSAERLPSPAGAAGGPQGQRGPGGSLARRPAPRGPSGPARNSRPRPPHSPRRKNPGSGRRNSHRQRLGKVTECASAARGPPGRRKERRRSEARAPPGPSLGTTAPPAVAPVNLKKGPSLLPEFKAAKSSHLRGFLALSLCINFFALHIFMQRFLCIVGLVNRHWA